ncbi:MAG TPA: FtsX-like permease family protein [Candidatus Acidoferrum sp.]|nr:FtsX-like permease family protein [Candidatus Acidoferrum sp.]
MMAATRSQNRQMFWRIVRHLLGANRGRLFVILLALGAGAAVTAALLNLQVDAKRRITTEFRAFGANVVITPVADPANTTMNQSALSRIPAPEYGGSVASAGILYAVMDAYVGRHNNEEEPVSPRFKIVFAGFSGEAFRELAPARTLERSQRTGLPAVCYAGSAVAQRLRLHVRDSLILDTSPDSDDKASNSTLDCIVEEINSYGGPEDNQVFITLAPLQSLLKRPEQISVIQLSVPGTPEQISDYAARLRLDFPGLDVRPVRQFTDAQAKIYDRISGLLNFTVGIVLALTALCVMAAMTNVAMERRNDVGLMKAIGGATRRVLRLFLAEAALLGLGGGVIGAAVGILLSIWLGKQVFGVAAQPRLIVYPVAVALTMIVAILSAYPLRRLASIRPASVFRGEG